MPDYPSAKRLDTCGKCCPMPMVETSMAIRALETGEVLEIVATDPGTKTDIPAWCKRSGNVLLKSSEVDGVFRFYVRKQ